MAASLSLFVSYAREDESFVDALGGHLSSLHREGLILGWHDRLITAGRTWAGDIDAALDRADIVILMVSAYFLQSDYCALEAARAVERWKANPNGLRVIPVIVRDVDWQKVPLGVEPHTHSLGLFNALPMDGRPVTRWPDPDQAYLNVALGLRKVVDEIVRQRLAPVLTSPTQGGAAEPRPADAGPPEAGERHTRDRLTAALDKLLPFVESDSITWFLGPRAASNGASDTYRDCDLARNLLAELRLVDRGWRGLLPPVDVAASYYAAKEGVAGLEHTVTEWIARGATGIPTLYQKIAQLLAMSQLRTGTDHRAPRQPRRNPPLIVTTNLDLMMERALLAEGLSFTRIVQHQAEPRLDVTPFKCVRRLPAGRVRAEVPDRDGQGISVLDLDGLDPTGLDRVLARFPSRTLTMEDAPDHATNQNPLESLALKDLPGPILYKLKGSLDVAESCAISAEQHFDFCLLMAEHFVPTQIRTVVAQTPAVLVGYGFLDPDFRLVYYTFSRSLIERKEKFPLYALQEPPERDADDNYRSMEAGIWEDLKESGPRKAKIVTIEDGGEHFLGRLLDRLDPRQELRQALNDRGLTADDGRSRG